MGAGNMNYKDTLNTERLHLRPLSPNDFDAVHSWAGNPENTRYMAWGPNTEDQTRIFLDSVTSGKDFAVTLADSSAVIGSCGIYPNEVGYMADIGWILHKDYWKRGYGTELCGELIRYGFENLKLGRIQAPCAAVNYGSYRIMERSGMQREALHRKAFWARVDKEWIDEAWYAILAEDYFRETKLNESANLTNSCAGAFKLEPISSSIRYFVDELIEKDWSGPLIAVHNTLYDTRTHPGFVAVEDGMIIGYILYFLADGDCEITVLESHSEGRGVGRALVDKILRVAKENACRRVWLHTSNDCIRAIEFYQKYGFNLRAVHLNAMDEARKLKPQIPLISSNGIPLKHEFEFEIVL
jgi:RimJ/RimL family protein N-acetyltransferase